MIVPASMKWLIWSWLVVAGTLFHVTAGEPAQAGGEEWAGLVEREAVLDIMAAADRTEQRWNDKREPLEYVRAVIPLCVALRDAQKLTPDLAQVLGEVVRRLAQKEAGELLLGKQRLAIELVNVPRGFGALPPDATQRYRRLIAQVLAILERQARDVQFVGESAVAKPTEGDRRVLLASQRLLNLLPKIHASFLVDWYGRAPIDLNEAQEMALLFALEPEVTGAVMRHLQKPVAAVPLPAANEEKLSGEEFHAMVVKELNNITGGNFDAEQRHQQVQMLMVRVLANQSPIMSLSAGLCGEALLSNALSEAREDVKAQRLWERRRQRDARLIIGILSACRRDRLTLADRQSLKQGAALPEEFKSLGQSLDEIDQTKIRDPELREQYRRLMAEHERRERLSDEQEAVDATLEEWPGKLEKYLIAAYSRPPLRYDELVEFMACAGFGDDVRHRILSAIVDITGDPPAAHLLTGWVTGAKPRF